MLLPPQTGFTLLELITVMAIVSLLLTISYPIYTHHLQKTHRTQGQIALLDLASAMERYYIVNNTYAGAGLANLYINPATESGYYLLEINAASESSYSLHAVPQKTQMEDKSCGTLALDQLGKKGISGDGSVADCWS
jgi:type IV pilus assembly protein PilE